MGTPFQENSLKKKTAAFSYAGEFEIHLTVQTDDIDASSFRLWCDRLDFKCVRIVLSRGTHAEQPMATWRRRDSELPTVLKEAEEYAASARSDGHRVVRLKIETPLGNANVPQTDEESSSHDPMLYFEHHLKLQRRVGAPVDRLRQVCEQNQSHLSRNAFARVDPLTEHRFVTLRSYGVGAKTSVEQVNGLLKKLAAIGENVIEQESEYCVYDSNLDLDAGWLPESAEPFERST